MDGFENVRKKIDECRKHRPHYICVTGPTPTLTIGTVTAGDPGTDVIFPSDGSSFGTSITRLSPSTFNLADIGTYQVYLNVPVTEAGQLEITLNNTAVASSVSGRATGTSYISGTFIIETTTANSVLTVRNPADNATALTITPNAGGTDAVSAHLVIMQLQ